MGEARTRLERFKQKHPFCCYCGGGHATESIDHAPPKTFFFGKDRPKGLEVPACEFCNKRHGIFDDFFSLVAMTLGSVVTDRTDPRLERMIASAFPRFPGAIRDLGSDDDPAKVVFDGETREVSQTYLDSDEIGFTIAYMAARMALALYYLRTGSAAPMGSSIHALWNSNSKPISADVLKNLLAELPDYSSLVQGRKDTSDQFEARFRADHDLGEGAFAFKFHNSFTSMAFLFPPNERSLESTGSLLFRVSEECIQPVNCAFPKHLRLNARE